jgi:hypothetical protein
MTGTNPNPVRVPGELSFKTFLLTLVVFSVFDITVYREVSRVFARQFKQPPMQIEVDASPMRAGQRIASLDHQFTSLDTDGTISSRPAPKRSRIDKPANSRTSVEFK